MGVKLKDLRVVDWNNPAATVSFTKSGRLFGPNYKDFLENVGYDGDIDKIRTLEGFLYALGDPRDVQPILDACKEVVYEGGNRREFDFFVDDMHYHVNILNKGKTAELSLNDQTKAVTERNKALEEMRLYKEMEGLSLEVAHNFKTMSMGYGLLERAVKCIENYIETGDLDEAEKAIRFVRSVYDSGKRFQDFSKAFIDMGKATSRMDAPLEKEYIRLFTDVVEPVISLLQPMIIKKNATPDRSLRPEPGDVTVYADRGRLGMAMFQLLSNALEYGGKKMRFAVGIESINEDERKIGSKIIVWNSKSYIPPEDREAVLDGRKTTGEKSTGIGLGVVTRIIEEEHGGKVSIESDFDKGIDDHYTKFILELYDDLPVMKRTL